MFIERYNSFINEAQKGIMNLSITRLDEQISSLKENRLKHKTELVKNFGENNIVKINELMGELEKQQIDLFKNDFTKADEKAKRIVARPFVVRQSKNDADSKEKEAEPDIIFERKIKATKNQVARSKDKNVKSNKEIRTNVKDQNINNQNKKVTKNTNCVGVRNQNGNIQNRKTYSTYQVNQNQVNQNKNGYYRNFSQKGDFSNNFSNNFSYNYRNTNSNRRNFYNNYERDNFHINNFNGFERRKNTNGYQHQYNPMISDRGDCQNQFGPSFNNNWFQPNNRPVNFRRTFMKPKF